jgi:N-acetylglucosaminyldiphosphoundecaprenol N-acetyl-beta-D-mannosaminyltransferase
VRRVEVLGVGVDDIDEAGAVRAIVSAARAGRGGVVVTPNVDILRRAVRDPVLGAMVAQADLSLPDGMPLVWASRLRGTPLRARVPASSLVYPLARAMAAHGLRLFLLGAEPGVAEEAARSLERQVPELVVAGTDSPPYGFEHDPDAMARIRLTLEAARPDVVLCAFGCPKQERVMTALRPHFPATWFLGVGGTLDMVAAHTPRAPRWLQRLGLEWVHRLRLEPRRLFRRYIIDDAPFALVLLARSAVDRMRAGRHP